MPSQAIALTNRDAIIAMVETGQRITDIAKAFGLSTHAAISRHLGKDPDYIAAREAAAEARLESREKDLEDADDSVTVARADRLLGHQRWRCEREFASRWGPKQEVTHVSRQLTADEARAEIARLEADLGMRTIEGEAVALPAQSVGTAIAPMDA